MAGCAIISVEVKYEAAYKSILEQVPPIVEGSVDLQRD